MTSSRRSCSKSTSMSGGSSRSLEYETLEQEPALVGRDDRDAEAITDRRIGRRAAALAEDRRFLVARPTHDVVNGQEKRFVFLVGDQRELLVELRVHGFGNAFGPFFARAYESQIAQMLARRRAVRARVRAGIRIFELAQVERAQRGDAQCFGERYRRDRAVRRSAGRRRCRSRIREQRMAGFGDRATDTDRSDRHPADATTAAHMHVHVAGSRPAAIAWRAPSAQSSMRVWRYRRVRDEARRRAMLDP